MGGAEEGEESRIPARLPNPAHTMDAARELDHAADVTPVYKEVARPDAWIMPIDPAPRVRESSILACCRCVADIGHIVMADKVRSARAGAGRQGSIRHEARGGAGGPDNPADPGML